MEHAYLCYSHEFTANGPTPHVLNTDNSPMYRSTVQADIPSFLMPASHGARPSRSHSTSEPPHGFSHNAGESYIHFPIQLPNGQIQNPQYVQAILSCNPMVIALLDNNDHVYAALLYARPILSLDTCEVYPKEDLLLFAAGYDEC